MKTITLEEHFVTNGFLKAIGAYGHAAPAGIAAMHPKLLDLGAGRIAAMDEAGIDVQVLSLASMGFDALPADAATQLAREVNDELAAAVRAYPTRYAGFAMVALKDPEAAAEELERAVTKLGFVGAMLDGTVSTEGAPKLGEGGPNLFLDDPRFGPVWETAARLRVPIYLHPALPPAAVREAYFSGMDPEAAMMLSIAGWQWHAETALHTLRLILSGLFDRLPGLQLIIGHMGEGLPYALARSSAALSAAAKGLRQPVAGYFRSNIHMTTSGYFTRPPFECALEVLGPDGPAANAGRVDRMMFSVDYPFSPTTRGREFLNLVSQGLSPEELEALTHGNAERVLRLVGTAA